MLWNVITLVLFSIGIIGLVISALMSSIISKAYKKLLDDHIDLLHKLQELLKTPEFSFSNEGFVRPYVSLATDIYLSS